MPSRLDYPRRGTLSETDCDSEQGGRTELARVLLDGQLVLLGVHQVRGGDRDGCDLSLAQRGAASGELRVVGDVLAAVARHATRELAGALVTPLEERKIISPAAPSAPVP